MELLASKDNQDIWFVEVRDLNKIDLSFSSEPLVCIIISNINVPAPAMKAVAKHLIAAGCRYGVCFGRECEEWETALDHAYLETDPNYSPPAETMVMTTAHKNDPLEDVIYFAIYLTQFSDIEFSKYIFLSIGHKDGLKEEITKEICELWEIR